MLSKTLNYKANSVINFPRLLISSQSSYKFISYISMEPPEKISNSLTHFTSSDSSAMSQQLRRKPNLASQKRKGPPRDAHLTHDQFMGYLDLTISDYYF